MIFKNFCNLAGALTDLWNAERLRKSFRSIRYAAYTSKKGLLISFPLLAVIFVYLSNREENSSTVTEKNTINEFVESGINEKLPNCTQPNLVGNGVCNIELNIAECDFDGNDCATATSSTSTSTITTCPDWSKVCPTFLSLVKALQFYFWLKPACKDIFRM